MDDRHYREMTDSLDRLEQDGALAGRDIYLFGHCNATEELVRAIHGRQYDVSGILDNNAAKQGTDYEGVPILVPQAILTDKSNTIVLVAARAYASMKRQLREIGYNGPVEKLVDYNSFSDYSLSDDTIQRMTRRLERGMERLEKTKAAYPGFYRIYCPFAALGDVSFAMAYLPYFLERKHIESYVVFVVGEPCSQVARMYGVKPVRVLSQAEMDEELQAVFYSNDGEAFIAHHDRPYMVKLYKALYIKKIPLEIMYRCGVYGLPQDTQPCRPTHIGQYGGLQQIPSGKSVVVSPYAKSVSNLSEGVWGGVIGHFRDEGFTVYTNTAPGETPLPGTLPLEVKLCEMQSVVERAGMFIGIRSGLCDVLRWADCRKIALYPDRFYSDTRWKMEEIYHLDGWENIVV